MAADLDEQELACIYAALILADDDIQVTAEKMKAILKAADVQVESIWPNLFAKSLQGQDIKQLIANSVTCGAAVAAGAAPAAGEVQQESKETKEEKKPEPESESEDDDLGLGLFD